MARRDTGGVSVSQRNTQALKRFSGPLPFNRPLFSDNLGGPGPSEIIPIDPLIQFKVFTPL